MSQITLSTLPKDILIQIPLSIRVKKQTYEVEELPESVQYLISNYIEPEYTDVNYNKKVYDLKPSVSIYSDLNIIDSEINVIAEYFRNYLLTSVTAYPFDVEYGCRLKQYLNTKDTSLQQTLITNEINNIAGTISGDFNSNIIVKKIEITPVPVGTQGYHAYTDDQINIYLSINNVNVSIVA